MGSYITIPPTGWPTGNRNSFLRALEAEKSQIKATADFVSGAETAILPLHPHAAEGVREPRGAFIRALILFTRAPPS